MNYSTEAHDPFVLTCLPSLDVLDQKCVHSDQLQGNVQLTVASPI